MGSTIMAGCGRRGLVQYLPGRGFPVAFPRPTPFLRGLGLSAAALLLSVVAGAASARSVDETRPAAPSGRVTVENVAGTVVVKGWDRAEVSVRGEIASDAEFEFTGPPENVSVIVRYKEKRRHVTVNHGSNLEVQVPAGSSLEIRTVSADVTVDQVSGQDLEIQSVSGGVTVTTKGLPDTEAGRMQRLELQSVSGRVDLKATGARVEAQSVSGDVVLNLDGGEVEASSVSGTARVSAGRLDRAEISSVSGDVVFEGGFMKSGRYEFTSHSGSVDLILPADTAAEFSVDTFSGDIESEFGGEVQRSSEYTPGKELELTLGSNGPRVDVSCFSGTVHLRKR